MKVLAKTEIYIFSFKMIHKYTGIERRTYSSHGTAFDLDLVFTVECKVIQS